MLRSAMPATVAVLLALCTTFATMNLLPYRTHADDCSNVPGTRPATAADAAVANGQIKAGTCYNPNDAGIGQSAEEAKKYIYSLATNSSTSDRPHIEKLNDKFAICAAQFFRDFQSKMGTKLRVTSAWRSLEDQARVSTAPQSNHTRGMAMDVHPANENYDAMMRFTQQNKQYGVCFPRPPYNGSPDLPHMILAGIGGGEAGRCAAQGITQPCNGMKIDPNEATIPVTGPQTSGPASIGNPTSNGSSLPGYSALSSLLRGGQSPPPPPSYPQQTVSQQATSPVQDAYQNQQQSTSPTSYTGTSTTGQTGQTQSSDYSGNANTVDVPVADAGSSTNDIIDYYRTSQGASSSAVNIAKGVEINLANIIKTAASTSLEWDPTGPQKPRPVGENSYAPGDLSYSSTGFGEVSVFQSSDLADNPAVDKNTMVDKGTFAHILDNLKGALAYLMRLVRPFAWVSNQEYYME